MNAVDNVEARRYIDNQCVWHSKPLFESGTLGTKCHSQIIIPHLTQSYNDLRDPEEKKVPLCTLKNFPYQIEHTIQWARDYFEGVYVEPSGNLCKFYENKKECIDQLVSQNSLNQSELRKKLESILKLHKSYSIKTYEICV